jgi:hypothetical protein
VLLLRPLGLQASALAWLWWFPWDWSPFDFLIAIG